MDKQLLLIILVCVVYGSWFVFKERQAKKRRQDRLNRIRFN
jgi:membrane-anchored protein YejM (alkaline phosphatase superfamily)